MDAGTSTTLSNRSVGASTPLDYAQGPSLRDHRSATEAGGWKLKAKKVKGESRKWDS